MESIILRCHSLNGGCVPIFPPVAAQRHFFALKPSARIADFVTTEVREAPQKNGESPQKNWRIPKGDLQILLGNLGIHFANAKKLTVTIHSDYTLDSWGSVGKIRPSSHIIKTASIQSKCSMRSSFSTRTLFEFLSTRCHQLTFHCGLAEAVCSHQKQSSPNHFS